MSIEPLVIAKLVKEGNLRTCYQEGVTEEDFDIHKDEFLWIEQCLARHWPVNVRTFRQAFPDFEWVLSKDRLRDLLSELKGERAYVGLKALFDSIDEDLAPENAIATAGFIADMAREIGRRHSPVSDVDVIHSRERRYEYMKNLRKLREAGTPLGVPTGIPSLQEHYDGLVNGRLYTVLGRPGEGKSYLIMKFAVTAMFANCHVAIFSPEMSEHEHRSRLETLASADEAVQEAAGLKGPFRNRDLMRGQGFDIKAYNRFLEYLESLDGKITLFTQKYRVEKMSVQFIENKIQDLGLDLVIIDPVYELKSPRRYRDSEWSEINATVSAVDMLGETYDIPIVITNWANRQGPKGDAPHQDSSYGTDAPAQKSDHVIGVLHESHDRLLILRGTKSRFGGNFRCSLRFLPNLGLMREVETGEAEDEEVKELLKGTP